MDSGERIRKRKWVLEQVGIKSPATLYRWIKNDNFPAAKKLGGGSVGWLESEVKEWIQSRPSVQ